MDFFFCGGGLGSWKSPCCLMGWISWRSNLWLYTENFHHSSILFGELFFCFLFFFVWLFCFVFSWTAHYLHQGSWVAYGAPSQTQTISTRKTVAGQQCLDLSLQTWTHCRSGHPSPYCKLFTVNYIIYTLESKWILNAYWNPVYTYPRDGSSL